MPLYRIRLSAVLLLGAAGFPGAAFTQQPTAAPATAPGPSGYHLAATWKPGGNGGWDYLTMDAGAHRLYITRTDRVQVIDTDKGTVIGEVPAWTADTASRSPQNAGAALRPAGKNGTVMVFDLKTLAPAAETIPVGKNRTPSFTNRSPNTSSPSTATARMRALSTPPRPNSSRPSRSAAGRNSPCPTARARSTSISKTKAKPWPSTCAKTP